MRLAAMWLFLMLENRKSSPKAAKIKINIYLSKNISIKCKKVSSHLYAIFGNLLVEKV